MHLPVFLCTGVHGLYVNCTIVQYTFTCVLVYLCSWFVRKQYNVHLPVFWCTEVHSVYNVHTHSTLTIFIGCGVLGFIVCTYTQYAIDLPVLWCTCFHGVYINSTICINLCCGVFWFLIRADSIGTPPV